MVSENETAMKLRGIPLDHIHKHSNVMLREHSIDH
jgi:hypothetical protein